MSKRINHKIEIRRVDKTAGPKYILFSKTRLNFNIMSIFNVKSWKQIYNAMTNAKMSRCVYINIIENRLQSKESNYRQRSTLHNSNNILHIS